MALLKKAFGAANAAPLAYAGADARGVLVDVVHRF